MDTDFVHHKLIRRPLNISVEDLYSYVKIPVVVIYGFPYDEGTIRNKGRPGGAGAYDQVIKLIEVPEGKTVLHLGHVPKDLPLEQAHEILYQHVAEVFHQLPLAQVLVIGGSNDQSYQNYRGLVEGTQCYDNTVINIDAHLDVRPLLDGKAHSGSPFRLILQHESNKRFIEFGIKGCSSSKAHHDYVIQQGGAVYFLERDIRRGFSFNNLMDTIQGQVFLSFDVDSIDSIHMPGVSAPSVVGGLTSTEAEEIMKIAGQRKVKLIDMSEFNPAVECTRSAALIAHLIYTFLSNN